MSNIDSVKWHKIDKHLEEAYIDGIRFVRPVNQLSIPLSCPSCNSLFYTVEDIEMYKKEKVCEECYLRYYYINKEKWKKGWRPNIIK